MTGLGLLLVVVLVGFAWGYWHFIAEHPEIHYQQTPGNQQLAAQMPSLNRRVWHTPWCFNPHLQIGLNLAKDALRNRQAQACAFDGCDYILHEGTGVTRINWLHAPERLTDTPIILILHTISGCGDDHYREACYFRDTLGWSVAVLDRRGHGGLPLLGTAFDPLGGADDLNDQVQHIKDQFPNAPLYGCGLSAGGCVLAKYLGRYAQNHDLAGAVLIGPGFDVRQAINDVHPFYSRKLAERLVAHYLIRHEQRLSGFSVYDSHCASGSLKEFLAPVHHYIGLADEASHQEATDPSIEIDNIKTPCLLLAALDDPICKKSNIERYYEKLLTNANVLLVTTRRGSHCCSYEGFKAQQWYLKPAGEYFCALEGNRQPQLYQAWISESA